MPRAMCARMPRSDSFDGTTVRALPELLDKSTDISAEQAEKIAARLRAHYRWSNFLLADIGADDVRTILAAVAGRELD